ncbi:hypothetical protein Forpe1208_v010576 [Fusarium oxysporum f. sp. rapae]|uniref:Uncharacterized protein n=1 Tax=Fusarium oxysporum f. sp. rapae TaxID=485398 RepID=A0A8J5TTQ0_FUSOX|nr:hypothetical protein Forpe1208_v010576 [Fusarium oxysporum f. sp. rapae]
MIDSLGSGSVGNGNVPPRVILIEVTLPPDGREVLFQLGEILLPDAASADENWLGSDTVGKGMKDSLDVLTVGIEKLLPGGRDVVFQLGDKLLPVVTSSEDDEPGSDTVGNGTNEPLEVLTVGTKLPLEALVTGTDVIPPEGREVPFQLGPKILPELAWLDSDNVGTGKNVPLEILTVGTELFPIDVVPFQLGPTLPLDEPLELAETEAVGNGTNVPLEILTVGTELLPIDPEVVPFQPGPTLPLDERPGLADSEAVGKGIVIVGNEPFPLSEVVFQLGATLPLDELPGFVRSEAVGNGMKLPLDRLTVGTEPFPREPEVVLRPGPTLPPVVTEPMDIDTVGTDSVGNGTKDPVPEIPPLGIVILEFHPVKVPVRRVPLSTGLDVELPGKDHGSESLVAPDRVVRLSDSWDVTPVLDRRVWVWLPDWE